MVRGERARLRRVYDRYTREGRFSTRWGGNPATGFISETRWALMRAALDQCGVHLPSAWILDLGAGQSDDCERFRLAGGRPERIIALDLLDEFVRTSRRKHPTLRAVIGDAACLPFQAARFDVVHQSLMLSSVPDRTTRSAILREVRRVLIAGGLFLSYDARYPNPCNKETRPLRGPELAAELEGWSMEMRSLTALPPLLRTLAPVSLPACRLVEGVPFLRSHLLVVARKPG